MSDVLPNSLATIRRGVVMRNGKPWVPIFCANCGADGGFVPEASVAEETGFAFYLCNPCGEKWAPIAGLMMVPDEVFWEKLREVQLEKFGRLLENDELIVQLADESSPISVLARRSGE